MIRKIPMLMMPVLLVSCASDEPVLAVNKFHLRDAEVVGRDSAMIRGEQRRLLYGAVSMEEQKQRLGEYFTVRWKLDEGSAMAHHGDTQVILKYQQAGTASKILKMSRRYSKGVKKGVSEFEIKGEDYQSNGRVLAWRVELVHAGKMVASQQSYMWD
ncbi:hypothetical protein SAMN02745181_3322 [Rubritalea squalenifaciens DSM 18772]|uniref:Uncharacterized protein n=1 Tax=Rubritalea squalenifaciens DSM 18772 TaxID=1123071 RepID=A0A1M6PWG6_9BACT|nr:hypothetical protein [Rubritalea squalenifaciens]SHK12242.1 hypothetical protein SAMN02745181_3322 [Rubritalea squalenifaciens DSM 18772]